MSRDDWSAICLFLDKNEGNVYQWKRFKVGIYALSKDSPDVKEDNASKIFKYKFTEGCYEGMNDTELLADMTSLHFLDIISRERVKLNESETTKHYLIKLTEKGKTLAREAESRLSKDELDALTRVALDLSNVEMTARELFKKYAPKWSEKYSPRLREIECTIG